MLVRPAWRRAIIVAVVLCVSVSPLGGQSSPEQTLSVEVSRDRLDRLETRLSEAEVFFGPSDPFSSVVATLEQAFPEFAGAPLGDLDYLRAAQAKLQRNRQQRASERRSEPPLELNDEQAAQWTSLLRRQFDIEDRLDSLRQRVIAGLVEGLRVAPGWSAEEVDGQLAVFRQLRGGTIDAESRERGLQIVSLENLLTRYRSASYRRMILGDDPALHRLVILDLDEISISGELAPGVVSEARRDRLRRAAPLLSQSLAERVRAVIGGGLVSSPQAGGVASVDELPVAAPPEPASDPPDTQRLFVDVTERLAAIESAERVRRGQTLAELQALEVRVVALESESARARGTSRFEPGRAKRLDTAYIELRRLVEEIRAAWHRHRQSSQRLSIQAVETRASIPLADRRDESVDIALAWRELLLRVERVFGERATALAEEEDQFMALLGRTGAERRELTSFTSREAQVLLVETLQSELVSEATEAPLWLWREVLRVGQWFWSMGERTRELESLRFLVSRSLDLLALLIGWVYVRSRATSWLMWLVDGMSRGSRDVLNTFASPARLARADVTAIALPGTDSLGWFLLHYFLLPRSSLLAFAALIGLSRSLYRTISALVQLFVSRSRARVDPMTGEVAISLESKALALRTVRWILTWWILFIVLGFFAWPLVRAYRWERLLVLSRWSVFALVAIYLLSRWSKAVRTYLIDHVEHNRITVWLTRARVGRPRSIVATFVGAVYLMARALFQLMVGLGWFRTLNVSIARSQLRESVPAPLAPEIAARILSERGPKVPRTEELSRLRENYFGWRADERRGMVAVVGDRGIGKTEFLEQVADILPESEGCALVAISLVPEMRSATFNEAVSEFSEPLGIEIPDGASRSTAQRHIQQRLAERESTVIVVDDFHYLLRRSVGGFEMVRFFLNIMQACSDQHFWILGLHRPAWRYVQGVSESVRVGFRDEISLSGLDAKRLGDSLLARTDAAGCAPDYESLVPDQVLDEDHSRAAERARATYWQLLTQSSAGNPTVATEYWIDSLGGGELPEVESASSDGADKRKISIHLFNPHLVSEVETMSDEYLFVLTALVVHDGLSLMELAAVLNQSVSQTQLGCQHLESLGILGRWGKFYNIAPSWQPAVLHVLDQKSFAHT